MGFALGSCFVTGRGSLVPALPWGTWRSPRAPHLVGSLMPTKCCASRCGFLTEGPNGEGKRSWGTSEDKPATLPATFPSAVVSAQAFTSRSRSQPPPVMQRIHPLGTVRLWDCVAVRHVLELMSSSICLFYYSFLFHIRFHVGRMHDSASWFIWLQWQQILKMF